MEGKVNTAPALTTAAWQTNNQNGLSGGSQIYVPSPTAGQKLTLNFTVPSNGDWVLQPIMVKTAFYGQVRFQIDGKDVGYTVPNDDWTGEDEFVLTTADLYSATNRFLAAQELPVGSTLDVGPHTLTIISTGKNPASGDTSFTIDALRLIKQA